MRRKIRLQAGLDDRIVLLILGNLGNMSVSPDGPTMSQHFRKAHTRGWSVSFAEQVDCRHRPHRPGDFPALFSYLKLFQAKVLPGSRNLVFGSSFWHSGRCFFPWIAGMPLAKAPAVADSGEETQPATCSWLQQTDLSRSFNQAGDRAVLRLDESRLFLQAWYWMCLFCDIIYPLVSKRNGKSPIYK